MKTKKYVLLICVVFSFAMPVIAQNDRNGNNAVLHQPPEVDFSWVNACLGDTTHFLNGSIRGISYQWYIYDKNMNKLDSSTNLDISYLFPSADTFFVFLQADNGHIASMTEMIVIDTALTCDFSFMHCANQFMNHSTCATSFFWDFGDGSTSTAQTPTHLYADTGYYTVKFIAYKGSRSDTAIKQIYVDPIAFPTGVITYYVSGDTVFVHAADSSAELYYNWKFGDFTPNVLYVQDTFHVYANPGTYILNFSDWNTCNTAYSSDTIVINPVNSISTVSPVDPSITIYPNPVLSNSEILLVKNNFKNETVQISIYNAWGRSVFEHKLAADKNELQISTSQFTEGIYFILLGGSQTKHKLRFIVAGSK